MIQQFVRSDGVSLVIVDYAQLVSPSGSSRAVWEAMGKVSAGLQYAAKKHEVAVIAVSQLNRGDTNSEPDLENLSNSSRFAHDANQVLLLDWSKAEKQGRRQLTRLLLKKNRHGPQVKIPIEIDFRSMRISEITEQEEDRGWLDR